MPPVAEAKPEVLVVGAGPVGVMMACELTRHGVPCRVVDQNDGPTPSDQSRALGVQARTLEVFRDVGVVDRVLAEGRKVHGISAFSEGRRIVHLSFALDDLDTAYPYVLILPQPRTERILLDRLASLGGPAVERQTRLVRLEQDKGGVTATLADASGREHEVRSGWLVGCDGSRGAVRKALGLSFEGSEYEERFLIADVPTDWKVPDDEMSLFLTPEGPLVVFPLLEAGRFRLVDTTGIVDSDDPARIVARFRQLIHDHAEPGATVGEADWTSSFRIHRRVVDRYRAGRCFVAGDAAHLHSPAGGQGMNTGLQDAYNLAWKLALVLRGASPEGLLDSYGAERRPVAAEVLKGSDRLTRLVTLRHEVARHLRNHLVSVLGEFDFVRRKVSRGMSELEVAYRGSPIVAEDRAGLLPTLMPSGEGPGLRDYLDFGAAPHPGDRVPDVAYATTGSGLPRRLFDDLVGTQHVLLLFEGAAPHEGAGRDVAAVGELIRRRFAEPIAVHLVVRGDAPAGDVSWDGPVIRDAAGDLHRRFGARGACLYLVRPDKYVGYRSQPVDAAKLEAYLGRIFT